MVRRQGSREVQGDSSPCRSPHSNGDRSQKDDAVIDWVVQMRSVANEMTQAALDVHENMSTYYTMEELQDKFRAYEEQSQKLMKLLGAARTAQFIRQSRYEQISMMTRRSWTPCGKQ
jgi:hypothetical protein